MKELEVKNKKEAPCAAPTVCVVELQAEGCLCGSFGRTSGKDPDDFEYGGSF